MNVLVTGASGRVGANLAQALLEKGHRVRAYIFPGDELMEESTEQWTNGVEAIGIQE